MMRLFKRKSCPSVCRGRVISEVLALTLSDGIRTWTEYVLPVKLTSNALVDVETVGGIRKTVNTSFIVCAERMTVIVNRENVSDWDCYQDRKGPVFKHIWYVVPYGWTWEDFDSRTDSSEVSKHIVKTEVVFSE